MCNRLKKDLKSGRSENVVSFLTYFRFPSSHTTVRAVRHTAVSCLSCPFWTPHIGLRHFFSIVGIRPIVLKREFLFGHLTTTVSKYTDCLVRQCTIRPFALTVTRSATSASADSSTFVVTIHGGLPRPRGISHTSFLVYLHGLRIKVTVAFRSFTVFGQLVRLMRLSTMFLFVRPRFRYCFFSPERHHSKLASRYRVRWQLRPTWTFNTDV